MIFAFLNQLDTLTAAPTSDGFPADALVTDEFDRRRSGLSGLLHGATLIPVTGMDEEELLKVFQLTAAEISVASCWWGACSIGCP